MMEKKVLIKAAKELVEVLGLEDEKTGKPIIIKTDMSQAELDKFFKGAISLIDPETDIVSKPTQKVVDSYQEPEDDDDADGDDDDDDDAGDDDTGDDEDAGDDDDDTGDDDDAEPEESLEDRVKAAKKVVELQELLKEPEFKAVRKTLAGEKNPIKLKKAMRDALGGGSSAPVEAKPKSASKEKSTVKKVGTYHRVDSVCETLKTRKPKTIESWIEQAAELYAEKTGKEVNLSESKTVIGLISKALVHFDIEIPSK